jgi:glycosyltransferase involved in cell wall biosynthesis
MCRCWHRRRRTQISLLVPFQSTDVRRLVTWWWLRRYWGYWLPDAEIIIGRDRKSKRTWYRRHPKPYSKAVAVNNAFRRSHGDIIAILDADAYLDNAVITHCARRIRAAIQSGVHLWFVPYLHLYRLTPEASVQIINSSVTNPLVLPTPPPAKDVEGSEGSGWGHYFGALLQIMPRAAFEKVGGMDPRFRGWGGEDVAFLKALDTLWGQHVNTPNDILHLWHPMFMQGTWEDLRGKYWQVRMWGNQTAPRANDALASRYHRANNKPAQMRALVNES